MIDNDKHKIHYISYLDHYPPKMPKLKTKKYQGKKSSGLKSILSRHLEQSKAEALEKKKEEQKSKIQESKIKKANQPRRKDQKGEKVTVKGSEDGTEESQSTGIDISAPIASYQIPFKKDDVVLLIGEGDFSFALSCIKAEYLKPKNLIATSFDTLEELKAKYTTVEENIQELVKLGVKVEHSIDATDIVRTMGLQTNKFSKHKFKNRFALGGHDFINLILFNFPHLGSSESNTIRSIKQHQDLLTRFFKSCQMVFQALDANAKFNGLSHPREHITGYSFNNDDSDEERSEYNRIGLSLFEGEPYDSWTVKILARQAINYQVERSGKLLWHAYPGYHHKLTSGMGHTSKEQSTRPARTYIFKVFQDQRPKKKKNEDDD